MTRLYYAEAEVYSSILFGTGLGLEIPELGHQERRLENQARPRISLQVVDIHARRNSVIGRSQIRRTYLWLWHKC